MADEASSAFVQALIRHQLLTGEQIEELQALPEHGMADPLPLAKVIAQREWLTQFQINQVLSGRAASLHVGSFILLERLEEDWSGALFKAHHERASQPVRLKLLRGELFRAPSDRSKAEQQLQKAAGISHSHVARIAVPKAPGFVAVLLEATASKALAKTEPLPEEQAVEMISQVIDALIELKDQGLLWPLVSPHQMALGEGGLRLTGLEQACLASQYRSYLTARKPMELLPYLAPELMDGKREADEHALLFSLGGCLFTLLTGEMPYEATVPEALQEKKKAPPRIERYRQDLSGHVCQILHRLLQWDPDRRYSSFSALRAALRKSSDPEIPVVHPVQEEPVLLEAIPIEEEEPVLLEALPVEEEPVLLEAIPVEEEELPEAIPVAEPVREPVSRRSTAHEPRRREPWGQERMASRQRSREPQERSHLPMIMASLVGLLVAGAVIVLISSGTESRDPERKKDWARVGERDVDEWVKGEDKRPGGRPGARDDRGKDQPAKDKEIKEPKPPAQPPERMTKAPAAPVPELPVLPAPLKGDLQLELVKRFQWRGGRYPLVMKIIPEKNFLAIGDQTGYLTVLDTVTSREVRRIRLFTPPIQSMAYSNGILKVGGRRMSWSYRVDNWQRIPLPHLGPFLSPDGRYTAGLLGGNVVVRDLEQNNTLCSFKPHHLDLTSAQFTPNGERLLVFTGGNHVALVDVRNRQIVREMDFLTKAHSLNLAPNGRWLAVGTEGYIDLVDFQTNQRARRLLGPEHLIEHLEFSPDGKLLCSAGGEEVRLWDVTTGRMLERHIVSTPIRPVRELAFSPDGIHYAAVDGARNVHIWKLSPWNPEKVARPRKGMNRAHTHHLPGRIKTIQSLDDSERIAIVDSDNMVGVWNFKTKRWTFRKPLEAPLSGFSFSGNGNKLIGYNTERKRVEVYRLPALTRFKSFFIPGEHRNPLCQFTPDGSHFLFSGARIGSESEMTLRSIENGLIRARLEGHRMPALKASFSEDGAILATLALDGVYVWDVSTSKVMCHFGRLGRIVDVALSPNGSMALVKETDKTVRLYETKTGQPVRNFRVGASSIHQPQWLGESPPQLLTWSLIEINQIPRSTLQLVGLPKGEVVEEQVLSGSRVSKVAVTPDRHYAITASTNAKGDRSQLNLWALTEGEKAPGSNPPIEPGAIKQVEAFPLKASPTSISRLVLSKDHSILATVSTDQKLRVWDLESRKKLWEKKLARGRSVAISPDGSQIVANGINAIESMDAKTGKTTELVRFNLTKRLFSPAFFTFTPDGRSILASMVMVHNKPGGQWERRTVLQMLNAKTGAVEKEWPMAGTFRFMSCTPDGTRLVTGGHRVAVLDLRTGKEVAELGRNVLPELTLSDDGHIVLCPKGRDLQYWKLEKPFSGEKILIDKGYIYAATTVTKGDYFLAACGSLRGNSDENRALVVDRKQGKILHSFRAHAKQYRAIVYDAKRHQAIAATEAGYLHFWDLKTIVPK